MENKIDNFYSYVDNILVFKRFLDLEDLKNIINTMCKLLDFSKDLYVKDIAEKSYYDNDFQDWEIMVVLGNNDYDLYDLTIYYTKTRINDNLIVETAIETI